MNKKRGREEEKAEEEENEEEEDDEEDEAKDGRLAKCREQGAGRRAFGADWSDVEERRK